MSLIHEFMADCTLLDKKWVPDGEGGFTVAWVDGGTIQAAISFENSIEARRAEKEGVSSVYSVITDKNVILKYHDVFRRESDKKIFRVTSDGDDKYTPESSTLNMRQVTAEEWNLT